MSSARQQHELDCGRGRCGIASARLARIPCLTCDGFFSVARNKVVKSSKTEKTKDAPFRSNLSMGDGFNVTFSSNGK